MSFGFGHALTAFKPITGGGAPPPATSLSLNFLSGTWDSAITFSRATTANVVNSSGYIVDAGIWNYVARSSDYLGASWTRSNTIVQTNLLLNSDTLVTQNVTTINAQPYTLSFFGSGTVTLSGTSTAGPLVGVDAVTRVTLTFTPTAGTLTLTVTGSVTSAQLVAGNVPGDYKATTAAVAAVLYADSNGIVRAQKVIENVSASAGHTVTGTSYATTGNTTNFQMKFKAGERNFVALVNTVANVARIFDLSTGSLGGTSTFGAPTNSTITAAGNGWWLCSITFPGAATATTRWQLCDSSNNLNYIGDGTSGVYACDTQVALGSTPGTYYDTTNSATVYFAPRLEYNPVTLALEGFFVEGTTTNLCPQSNGFTTTPWAAGTDTNVVSAGAVVSPDGTADAFKVYASDTLVPAGHVNPITKGASSVTYTGSIFAKPNGYNWLQLNLSDNAGNGANCWFNVSTGAIGSNSVTGTGFSFTASSAVIKLYKEGFYRCSFAAQSNTATTVAITVIPTNADATTTAGNTAQDGLSIFGAQVENSTAVSSYVTTTTLGVTRQADVATYPVSSWYNATEGTFVAGANSYTAATSQRGITSADDGTTANRLTLTLNSGYLPAGTSVAATATQAALSTVTSPGVGTPFKIAFGYKLNDYAISTNGAAVVTDTVGTVPTGITTFRIGQAVSVALSGYVRFIDVYNTRKTNPELVVLST